MSSLLTVFTPTYNRAHTLPRVYESLLSQTEQGFKWLVVDDGSTDDTRQLVQDWINEGRLDISYVHKENGGLYTGYNKAYELIDTELCVCIDSDDAMPPQAVEVIANTWRSKGSPKYAGIIGLDLDMATGSPLGGYFPSEMQECYFPELYAKKIHRADSKQVMRTDLMREVAPQVGFPGEKNFNPVYMLLQVCDRYPLIVVNEGLCLVEYQSGDSMSASIWRQYTDSPRSFAKMRLLEMSLIHTTVANRFRCSIHYVTESLIAGDRGFFGKAPEKLLLALALIPGYLLYKYIRRKAGV